MNLDLMTHKLSIQATNCTPQATSCDGNLDALTAVAIQYMKHDARIVCWQLHRVVWGTWQDSGIHMIDKKALEAEYIEEIRIFNEMEELHLRRQGQKLIGRYITDEEGEPRDYIDSMSPLWGNECEDIGNGYCKLKDSQRKFSMVVPVEKKGTYYALVTRNYIKADEKTHQAGYDDYRFVAIAPEEEES